MTPRTLMAAVFVALCLALSGFVLRRQIASRPAPPPDTQAGISPAQEPAAEWRSWKIAPAKTRQAVVSTIQGQLDALRAGDDDRAIRCQSDTLRRRFRSGKDFAAMIKDRYPEFGDSRAAWFGPVRVDSTGRLATVLVRVQGKNGKFAGGGYHMILERDGFRVDGVDSNEYAR